MKAKYLVTVEVFVEYEPERTTKRGVEKRLRSDPPFVSVVGAGATDGCYSYRSGRVTNISEVARGKASRKVAS
jgi:hypothetical protein